MIKNQSLNLNNINIREMNMDIKTAGQILTERTKVNTLDQVNVALFKNNKEQAKQHMNQLIESIEPVPIGNKGHIINTKV